MPRNEALVIEDIRMVMAAEEKYAAANGGYYDRVECLVSPTQCIPYRRRGPSFFEGSERRIDGLLSGSRGFYALRFRPGPHAEVEGVSPSSVHSYAFVAYPVFDGPKGFCGDSTGTLCVKEVELGTGPWTDNGKCADPDCVPLEIVR